MWYCLSDKRQYGPFLVQQASDFIRLHPDCMVWQEGMEDWLPAEHFSVLTSSANTPAADRLVHSGLSFQIRGDDLQYVEIDLAPEASVIAEPGSVIYKGNDIAFEAVLSGDQSKGFLGRMASAGKRILSGERAFLSVFSNTGHDNAIVAFSAPYPGKIIPVFLKDFKGGIICQKNSFLCAEPDIDIGVYFQKKILTAMFGGAGFIMQRLTGEGIAFIHAGGSITEFDLRENETIQIDAGCLVAFTPAADFSIQDTGSFKSQIFGGSGWFFATLKGPGKVWVQSLPFTRLVSKFASNLVVKQK